MSESKSEQLSLLREFIGYISVEYRWPQEHWENCGKLAEEFLNRRHSWPKPTEDIIKTESAEYELTIISNDGDVALAAEHAARFVRAGAEGQTKAQFLMLFPVGMKFKMKREKVN